MNEIVQVLQQAVETKNVFTVDSATFLAATITAAVAMIVNSPVEQFGSCGKTKEECNNPELFDPENQCLLCD